MTPEENPVGAMFLEWNTFEVNYGGIFYGCNSEFQLIPIARDGNAWLFCRVKPINAKEFKKFTAFLIKQNRLPAECESTHFQDLFPEKLGSLWQH